MKVRDEFLPFHMPSIGEAEIEAVSQALRDGWISSGPRVAELEARFAEFIGCAHAVAVNSGTAALHLALEALGVGPGDEVIVPVMTFAATAEAALYLGARPVLVDCRPGTLEIDPAGIEAAITPATKAVVPVHHGGKVCDMDAVNAIARERGLAVVEDAAHALPAFQRERMAGTLADAAAFSFYATKPLAAGEGGMITTDNEAVARRARVMRLHGITHGGEYRDKREGTWDYRIESAGFKYNMAEPQAAIALVQLGRQGEFLERRLAIARRYSDALAGVAGIEIPTVSGGREHAWHLYVIRLDTEALAVDRAAFIAGLRKRNVGASVHFIPLHLQPYYAELTGRGPGDFPVAEEAFERIVSLPIWPGMSDDDVDYVVEAVRDTISRN